MQFRAVRMPMTLATIMKIYKNTDQKQKRFLARVFHLKMELLMNRRPRVRKRQSRPRKYFVYMYTLKGNIYLLILCLATMGKVSQTCIFCKCLYSNLIYVFNPLVSFKNALLEDFEDGVHSMSSHCGSPSFGFLL